MLRALGLLVLLTALPARAETFTSPNGWSVDLPPEWEAFTPEDLAKLKASVPGMTVEGAWRSPLEVPFAYTIWWDGPKPANQAAAVVAQAGDRQRFAELFVSQMAAGMSLTDIEVRKHDARKHVVSLGATTVVDGTRLRLLVAVQATKKGAVGLYFCSKEEDRDIHSATFDGMVGTIELAPGNEYVPFPTTLVAGTVGVVVAVGSFLAARARKQRA